MKAKENETKNAILSDTAFPEIRQNDIFEIKLHLVAMVYLAVFHYLKIKLNIITVVIGKIFFVIYIFILITKNGTC